MQLIVQSVTLSQTGMKRCFFAAYGFCLVAIVTSERKLLIVVTHKEILSNERWVNYSLAETGHETNVTYLAYLEAVREIRDMKTYFTYSVRAFNGAIQNPILSRWADPCELIRRPPREKLIKMYYDPIVKNSRIIRCPFKPGDNMLLNITPSLLPVPNFIPENDFYIEATTYTRARTKIIFESRVYGSLLRFNVRNKNS